MFAVGRRQDGEADAAQVEVVIVGERGGGLWPGRLLQQVARGAVVAPVEEGAFAVGIELDQVEARRVRGVGMDVAGIDAVRFPAHAHFAAERVGAERADVVHTQGVTGGVAGEVGGGVQGVAAVGLLHGAEGGAVQFDHAFADDCDGFHGCCALG